MIKTALKLLATSTLLVAFGVSAIVALIDPSMVTFTIACFAMANTIGLFTAVWR